MARVLDLEEAQRVGAFEGAVCVIGVFDGLHCGHRFIIDEAIRDAQARDARCIILTFDADPDEMFGAGKLRKLATNEERISALAATGADDVVVMRFDSALASMSPARFLATVLGDAGAASIHVGEDFRFGADARGTVRELRAWADAHGAACTAHGLLERDGAPVTSTRIRGLLGAGDVRAAADLLGHPYAITGTVMHGREAGREMGIRTANLFVPPEMQVLGDGVYAAYAQVDGRRYQAAVSVGIPPTFIDEAESNLEAHLLDFTGDLYGKRIRLDIVHRLRDMRRFDDVAELVAAINGDIAWVRQNL